MEAHLKKYFHHGSVEIDLQDFCLCNAPINIILIFVVIRVILAEPLTQKL